MLDLVTSAWQLATERVAAVAMPAGFDLVHAFSTDWLDADGAPELLEGVDRSGALGILLGNSRALWAPFLEALRRDPELAADPHPLDRYAERVLATAREQLAPLVSRVHFAHTTRPRALPFQRLAEQVGFVSLSPSHLSVHELHGPWIGLRALLVIDLRGPSGPAPAAARPCQGCTAPCLGALERALAASGRTELNRAAIVAHAASWIAVRDACPVGRDSRYPADQLNYHYTADRRHLRLRSTQD